MRKARALSLADHSVVQPAFMEPAHVFQANAHSHDFITEHYANGNCPLGKPGPDTDAVRPADSKRKVSAHST
jgi:hypothetical protein